MSYFSSLLKTSPKPVSESALAPFCGVTIQGGNFNLEADEKKLFSGFKSHDKKKFFSEIRKLKFPLITFKGDEYFHDGMDKGIRYYVSKLPPGSGLRVSDSNGRVDLLTQSEVALAAISQLPEYTFLYLDPPQSQPQESSKLYKKFLQRLGPNTIFFVSQEFCSSSNFDESMNCLDESVSLCLDYKVVESEPLIDKFQKNISISSKKRLNLFIPLSQFYKENLKSIITKTYSLFNVCASKKRCLTFYVSSSEDIRIVFENFDKVDLKSHDIHVKLLIGPIAQEEWTDFESSIKKILNSKNSRNLELIFTTKPRENFYSAYPAVKKHFISEEPKFSEESRPQEELDFLRLYYLEDFNFDIPTAIAIHEIPPLSLFRCNQQAGLDEVKRVIDAIPPFYGLDLSRSSQSIIGKYIECCKQDSLVYFDQYTWTNNPGLVGFLFKNILIQQKNTKKNYIIYIPFFDEASVLSFITGCEAEGEYNLLIDPDYFLAENQPALEVLITKFNRINFFIPPMSLFRDRVLSHPKFKSMPALEIKYKFNFCFPLKEDVKFRKSFKDWLLVNRAITSNRLIIDPITPAPESDRETRKAIRQLLSESDLLVEDWSCYRQPDARQKNLLKNGLKKNYLIIFLMKKFYALRPRQLL